MSALTCSSRLPNFKTQIVMQRAGLKAPAAPTQTHQRGPGAASRPPHPQQRSSRPSLCRPLEKLLPRVQPDLPMSTRSSMGASAPAAAPCAARLPTHGSLAANRTRPRRARAPTPLPPGGPQETKPSPWWMLRGHARNG